MKHVENRIFLNSDDLFIGTQISFYHRENLDTGANYSLLLPKYLYIYFFLLLFCVHVCTTVHIVHVQFTTFSLWFFLLRKSKTSKNRNRKFFYEFFFVSCFFPNKRGICLYLITIQWHVCQWQVRWWYFSLSIWTYSLVFLSLSLRKLFLDWL
jgi:hypothetical protein